MVDEITITPDDDTPLVEVDPAAYDTIPEHERCASSPSGTHEASETLCVWCLEYAVAGDAEPEPMVPAAQVAGAFDALHRKLVRVPEAGADSEDAALGYAILEARAVALGTPIER